MANSTATNGSAFKVPQPRLALITPSASPPFSRTLTPQRARSSSARPPPSKRPRLSATPSSSLSSIPRGTPTFLSPSSTDQSLQDARRTSQMNVLKIWDSLADRHFVPPEEDDIIDLRNGKILKEGGYLRRNEKTFNFGCFGADEDASSDIAGAQTDVEEVDDDVDELDSFAPGADISAELEKRRRRLMPPQEMNPSDAEDLKKFLEAEAKRRELIGDLDEDDDDEEDALDILGALARGSDDEEDGFASFDEDLIPDGSEGLGPPESSSDGPSEPIIRRVRAERALTPQDDESEDEFAAWEIDYTPIPVSRATPQAKSRSIPPEADVIDLTSPSPPSSPLSRPCPISRAPSKPLPLPPIPTPKPISRAKSKTPARRIRVVTPPEPPAAVQLQTPPLSSPSHPLFPDDLLDFRDPLPASSPPPPLSSPTPQLVSRPRPKPRPLFRAVKNATLQHEEKADSSVGSSPLPNIDFSRIANSPKPKATAGTSVPVPRSTSRKPKVVAEVVLPLRVRSRIGTPSSPHVPSSVTPERNAERMGPREDRTVDTPSPKISRKDKGKARDLGVDVNEKFPLPSESSLPPSSPSPAPLQVRKLKASSQQHRGESQPSSSRKSNQKRKRVASSPSGSAEDDTGGHPRKEPTPPPPPQEVTRKRTKSSTPNASGQPKNRSSPRASHQDSDDSASESGDSAERRRSPSKTRRPSAPPHNIMLYPYGVPYTSGRDPDETQYPPPAPIYPIQDPQAQLYFVQAVQHLSYLMSGASTPGFPSAFPQSNWPPVTPKHHRRKQTPKKGGSSSSQPPTSGRTTSGPSSSRGRGGFQYAVYPDMYSSGTLPPSSPPVSVRSSPARRPKSALRSRSKSKGRRVSFRVDAEDRPLVERVDSEEGRGTEEEEEEEEESEVGSAREVSPEIPLAVPRSGSPRKSKKLSDSGGPSRKSVD